MKAFLGTAMIAFGILAQPAIAQEAYDPSRVISSVETKDLVTIVNSLGDKVEKSQDDERVVIATTPSGLRYVMYGTACDNGDVAGCQGVMIQVRYDVPDETNVARVNKANIGEGAIAVWIAEDRSALVFKRYVILDHGVTMANLRENVIVLRAIVPSAMAYAKGEK